MKKNTPSVIQKNIGWKENGNNGKRNMKQHILSVVQQLNDKVKSILPTPLQQFLLRYEGLALYFIDPPDYNFPKIVGIETTNKCNLKCSHCPNHMGWSPRKEGIIEKPLFKKLIKEISKKSSTKRIELHKDGEPLMHPEIDDLIVSAKKSGLRIKLTTNGLLLKPHIARKIFEAKVDIVELSIGAAYPETYSTLRGGNLARLESVINEAIKTRKEIQDPLFTNLIFQIIRTPKIRGEEINEFLAKWGNIPNSTVFIKDYVDWGGTFSTHKNNMKRYPCGLLWMYPSINWNGKVSACCVDWKEELIIGDVNKQSIGEVWKGEKLKELRKMHINGNIPHDIPCYNCNGWTFMSRMFNLKIEDNKSMPTKTDEIYECKICGAVVKVKEGGPGTLVCCGKPMKLKK